MRMPDDSHIDRQDESAVWQARSWTSRDGLKLFYRDYGGPADRPPIICLPGLTRNSRDFDEFANHVAGRFRVIAPDFRGRGMSERDPEPARYLPTTYAADVVQLLDELKIDRAIFVGTSLGGLVTMLIATMQPQRIVATILNDVGPEIDQNGIDRIRSYVGKGVRFRDWDEAADFIAKINRDLPASNGHGDWVRMARRLCKEDGDGITFDYDMAIAEAFNQSDDGAAPALDLWPFYKKLNGAPLLLIRGELSDLLTDATAHAMVEAIPGAELVTVPGVGHAPELNEPEAVAAIDRMLQRFAPAA
jgi:pimeloyl-ACP methyl ester carboxylesterase